MATARRPGALSKLKMRRRNALLWGISLYLASQLAFSFAVETSWSQLRDPEYIVKLSKLAAQLKARPAASPLVLLLGSSRVGYNIRPDSLPPWRSHSAIPIVFNFALCSSDPVMEYLCLRRLLDDGVRPDWVCIEVSPMFFAAPKPGQPGWADQVDPKRLTCRDLVRLCRYHSRPATLLWEYFQARLLSCSAHRFLLLNWLAPSYLPSAIQGFDYPWHWLDARGWVDIPALAAIGETKEWQARTERTRAGFPWFEHFQPRPLSDWALHDLAQLCRRQHISIAWLRMPDYLEQWCNPTAKAEMDAYMAQILTDSRAPVIDMRDWVPDQGFWDGVHFIHATVSSFTEAFGADVLEPLLDGHGSRKVKPPPALNPIALEWRGGFSCLERSPAQTWRWCSAVGELRLTNPCRQARRCQIRMTCRPASSVAAHLSVQGLNLNLSTTVSADCPATIEHTAIIEPGQHVLRFDCRAAPHIVPADPRVLVFRVEDFSCREID